MKYTDKEIDDLVKKAQSRLQERIKQNKDLEDQKLIFPKFKTITISLGILAIPYVPAIYLFYKGVESLLFNLLLWTIPIFLIWIMLFCCLNIFQHKRDPIPTMIFLLVCWAVSVYLLIKYETFITYLINNNYKIILPFSY